MYWCALYTGTLVRLEKHYTECYQAEQLLGDALPHRLRYALVHATPAGTFLPSRCAETAAPAQSHLLPRSLESPQAGWPLQLHPACTLARLSRVPVQAQPSYAPALAAHAIMPLT
jgi:hypothetical protein